jgi:hypothetical protein
LELCCKITRRLSEQGGEEVFAARCRTYNTFFLIRCGIAIVGRWTRLGVDVPLLALVVTRRRGRRRGRRGGYVWIGEWRSDRLGEARFSLFSVTFIWLLGLFRAGTFDRGSVRGPLALCLIALVLEKRENPDRDDEEDQGARDQGLSKSIYWLILQAWTPEAFRAAALSL